MVINYFELFGIPVSLHIDRPLLQRRYYELSRQFHPDMHTSANPDIQATMLEKSATVNKGFKVLSNPALLLPYILELKGVLKDGEKYQLDPAFLMEMMDLNERLADLSSRAPQAEIQLLQQELTTKEDELYNEIKPIIETYNDTLITDAALENLKIFYFKQKYFLQIKKTFPTFATRN
jgi:molecular chaperone HscB